MTDLPTKAELMEYPNDTLALLRTRIDEVLRERHVYVEAVPLHAGNVETDRPLPLLVRLVKKLPMLPPADLQKLEVLVDGCQAARGDGAA